MAITVGQELTRAFCIDQRLFGIAYKYLAIIITCKESLAKCMREYT